MDKICKMKNVARSLAGVFLDLASFERGRIRTFSHSQEVEGHRQCCGCAVGLGAQKVIRPKGLINEDTVLNSK